MRLLILLIAVHQCYGDSLLLKFAVKAAVGLVDLFADRLFPPAPLPELDQDTWWGEGSFGDENTTITPYTVQFSAERIQSLIEKLLYRENFTLPLNNASFSYGMNSTFLDLVLDYWGTSYNFTAREARINSYPQFMTNIQGLDIHYYHIKPNITKTVVPLLMLHGWPVSNMEFLNLFPELIKETEEYDYVFEIIAPSVPGFGYSQASSKIGCGSYHIAIMMKNLMKRLGYNQFYIYTGDIGVAIATDMAAMYQDEILGLHTNLVYNIRPKTGVKYLLGALEPSAVVADQYEDRLYPIQNVLYFLIRYFGYFHMHATKPDTIGIALEDSPSGLASWILTIMSWSSNPNFDNYPDGGLPETFSFDDLCDVLTILWDAKATTTSIRFYAETTAIVQDPNILKLALHPIQVPYSVIKFKHEIFYQPDNFLTDKYPNLVHSTTLDYGGHFAAFENPNVLSADIWKGVQKMIEFNENMD